MINIIKNKFALTESGAKGLLKASVSAFFMYTSYMLTMFIILFFVDDILNNNIKSISFYIIEILIISIVISSVVYINYNALYTETYKESANLRIEIAETLRKLPISYFSKHDVSDLSQVIMSDVERIEHAMSHAIPNVIGFSAYFCLIGIMMLIGNIKLALCVLLPIIVSFTIIVATKKYQVKVSGKYFDQLRENSESFQEAIELQQEIKSFALEEKIKRNLNKKMDESEKIHIRTEFSQILPVQISTSILKLTLGFTIFFGTGIYLKGETSLLYLIAYIITSAKMMEGVEAVYENIGEIFYIDARVKRIKDLKESKMQNGEKYKIDNYDIEFRDVGFSYSKDGRKIIDGVSFIAKQNQVTALVGPSGCGKSTILKLMSRLYDNDSGKILIDGKNINEIDTDSLFEKISIVFQDVSLFNASIMDNIRLGNIKASDEEVIRAAKYAGCDEFIQNLPEAYNTKIGENGSRLSGGERQRISIARAILKDAPIIILDEISASLDIENEKKIQESLNKLIENKTVMIISHRLKSIENVDNIIVMESGRIESQGSHRQLLSSSKLYQSMIEKSKMTEEFLY